MQVASDWTVWGGVRHSRLHRLSSPTAAGDPTTATDYRQSFTTPWLAVSHQLAEHDMVYLSWGEGVESAVTPNSPDYKTPGQPLPSTLSRQWEAGWKHAAGADQWGLTVYDIEHPEYADIPVDPSQDASPTNPYLHVRDGLTRARGLEAQAQTRAGGLTLRASAMVQRVRREGSADPATGAIPPNVPERSLKVLAAYAIPALPGLSVLANMAYEGKREVTPGDTAQIPAWTRFDLDTRYTQQVAATTLIWRAGVDNLFDRRAWREAPYQYDHAYLFPLAPRTFHASVEAKF